MSIWSLLAAMVASGTALWIAYRVYPKQKEIDRANDRHSEAARAYNQFFTAASGYLEDVKSAWRKKDMKAADKKYSEVLVALDALILYAPQDVMLACKRYAEALFHYFYAVRYEVADIQFPQSVALIHTAKAFRQATSERENAQIRARMNLLGCSEEEAKSVIYQEPR